MARKIEYDLYRRTPEVRVLIRLWKERTPMVIIDRREHRPKVWAVLRLVQAHLNQMPNPVTHDELLAPVMDTYFAIKKRQKKPPTFVGFARMLHELLPALDEQVIADVVTTLDREMFELQEDDVAGLSHLHTTWSAFTGTQFQEGGSNPSSSESQT